MSPHLERNILFKGNNLDVLKAMQPLYANSIKCVYLDPPYNTGVNRKHFDDDRNSADWVYMMRQRLELIKPLMRDDGSLWISIDDSELCNLKNLCDEIFGKQNFLATITWQHKINWDGYQGKFQLDHTYILAYRKTEAFHFENNAKPKTVWLECDVGGHADAIAESANLFGKNEIFSTPKPEKLIRYLLELTTKENELVLDCFSGSGTTGSAAHKMNRRWIMMEIGGQCETHILPRLNQIASLSAPNQAKQKEDYSRSFFYFPEIGDYQAFSA